MKYSHILALSLTGILLAGLILPVSGYEAILEPIPVDLKVPAAGDVYEDDQFFTEAEAVFKSFSNRTIPTGSQQMRVYGAYIRLRGMSISPDNYDDARAALAVIYYTAKASEAYETYFDVKKSVASLTDGSEFYDLAEIYYMTVSNWWKLIRDRYPKVTLYTLPYKDDPFPEDDAGLGTVLEGLKLPLIMTQIQPNPNRTYQDNEVKTIIQRWVEDNLEYLPNESDLDGQSIGNYFLTSEGMKFAKTTYLDVSAKNVRPEFYDTANYIDAFLYFLAESYDYYEQYLEERTSVLLISDGEKPYLLSRKYYDQAGVALTYFASEVPYISNQTALPPFPDFDEVERGRKTLQEQDEGWDGLKWGGASGVDGQAGHSGLW